MGGVLANGHKEHLLKTERKIARRRRKSKYYFLLGFPLSVSPALGCRSGYLRALVAAKLVTGFWRLQVRAGYPKFSSFWQKFPMRFTPLEFREPHV
jgi:hypothetical protein